MRCLFWNIRGIGNSSAKLALKSLFLSNKLDLLFVAEPKVDFNSVRPIFWRKLHLRKFAVNSSSYIPSLWCFCSVDVNPSVICIHAQFVAFYVRIAGVMYGIFYVCIY